MKTYNCPTRSPKRSPKPPVTGVYDGVAKAAFKILGGKYDWRKLKINNG